MPAPIPKLAQDWRERAGAMPMQAEARRRIDAVLSSDDQMLLLHDMQNLLIQHGTDVAKWPTEARARKADIDQKWTYVRDIKERVRAMKSAPANPASDKNWPTRIK